MCKTSGGGVLRFSGVTTFRSACHDPSDDAALVILLHVYGGCNEHNEVFIVCSNRHVGEDPQLLLGQGVFLLGGILGQ